MEENNEKGEIVLYQPEGDVRLEVRVENETVWLTQAQMVRLFDKDQSVIARHIKNVFKEGELPQESNMQILHNTLSKFKPTTIYSLDVIISVGYRVKSFRGTLFRQWANKVLKDYMLKGYAVRQRKIATDLQITDRLQEQHQLIINQGTKIAEFKDATEKRFNEQDSRLSTVEQHIDFAGTAENITAGTNEHHFTFRVDDIPSSAFETSMTIAPYITGNIDGKVQTVYLQEKTISVNGMIAKYDAMTDLPAQQKLLISAFKTHYGID